MKNYNPKSKNYTPAAKTLAFLISLIFLTSNILFAAPDFYYSRVYSLRGLSFLDRKQPQTDGAAILGELSHVNAHNSGIMEAHEITAGCVTDDRALIIAAQKRKTDHKTATIAHVDANSPFPALVGATSNPQDAPTRERLIAAGQTPEALKNLGIIIGAGGEGGRLLSELVKSKFITEEEMEQLTKPTIPISPIQGYSPLAIQLKIIAYVCKKFKVNIPVCVAMSPLEANQPQLERFLAENNNFGIENLTTIVQNVNATYDPQTGSIKTKADGTPILKPNGIAGIFAAMKAKGKLGWFRERFRANEAADGRLLYLNGDNIIDPELLFMIAGAAAVNRDKAFIGFAYAADVNSSYGRFCNVVRDGVTRCEVVEKAEMDTVMGLEEACRSAGTIAGNSNTMLMRLDGRMEERIDRVVAKRHALLGKKAFGKGVVKQGEWGEKEVDHVEAWVTDFPGEYQPAEVATVNIDDRYRGIKNAGVRGAIEAEYAQSGRGLLKKLAQAHGVAITIEDGAVIEFEPGVDLDTVKLGANCVVRAGARLFINNNADIKADTEFLKGTRRIGDPVSLSKMQAAREAAQILAETEAAVRKTFVHVGKPITLLPYTDGLGGTYTGVAQIAAFMLKADGRELPPGQEYFVSPEQVQPFLDKICAEDPYIRKETLTIPVDDGRGGSKMQECVRYYNVLYRKILNERRDDITDQEIDYLLQNLADNSVARYLIMYLKGVSVRAAADALRRETKVAGAQKGDARIEAWRAEAEAARAEEGKFSAVWKRIGQRAQAAQGAFTATAAAAWADIQGTRIDPESGLPLGNPDAKPFAADLDINTVDASAVKINEDIIGRIVATVSGIRGPYGDPFGDLPLPPTFSGRHFDCGTKPIPAALVSAATQVELLKRMIDDPEWFVNQIPLNAMKGATQAEKAANLEATKKRCLELLKSTQAGKAALKDNAKQIVRRPKFVIIRDTRSTGDALADVDIRSGLSMKVDVEYGKIASVTAAANYVRSSNDVDIGIYISASHNPESDNGLKILLGDGRVAPSELAYPFIYVFRQLLKQAGHTQGIIAQVNAVSAEAVSRVIDRSEEVNKNIRRLEKEYLLRLVTGCVKYDDAVESMKRTGAIVKAAGLAIVLERNGSSGNVDWLEDFGFLVRNVNDRPRYDMNHPLCPYPAAVAEANPAVEAARAQLAGLGFTTYLVQDPDTDADRSLFQVISPDGKLFVRPDHVERTFIPTCVNIVLNNENWDFARHQPVQDDADPTSSQKNRIMAFCVNDPSSIGMEMAADVMGFIVLRRQVGEANIADGMTALSKMTWGQAKKFADERAEWIHIPKKLREQFADSKYDNCPITSLGGGEASNGSFFNLQALVRDPANHLGSYLKILDPVEGKRRVKEIFDLFGKSGKFDESWWEPQNLRFLPYRLLEALPPTKDQDFFAAKGTAQIENPPIPLLGKVSDHLDRILAEEGGINDICRSLEAIWEAQGVRGAAVEPVFLNLDDKSYVGVGNFQKEVPIGLQPRGGGYEVVFVLKVKGNTYPFSWGWKRGSLTESRLTRTGPSAGFPIQAVLAGDITAIGPMDEDAQKKIVDECYSLIELQFTGVALRRAMAFATKECLDVKPGVIPQTTKWYIDALNGGEVKFFQMQENLRKHMENENTTAKKEVKETGGLVGSDVLERVRFAFLAGELEFETYCAFLQAQFSLAEGLRIQAFIGEYIKEAVSHNMSAVGAASAAAEAMAAGI